jgi:hypothetical protein
VDEVQLVRHDQRHIAVLLPEENCDVVSLRCARSWRRTSETDFCISDGAECIEFIIDIGQLVVVIDVRGRFLPEAKGEFPIGCPAPHDLLFVKLYSVGIIDSAGERVISFWAPAGQATLPVVRRIAHTAVYHITVPNLVVHVDCASARVFLSGKKL